MNEYDSSKIRDLLHSTHQLTITENPADADVLLLNTCSVREKAQEKVFSHLGRWRKFKQLKPDTIIGVGGCVASQEGEAIQNRAPYVDVVFGPQTLHRLPQMLDSVRQRSNHVVDVSFPEIEKFDCLPKPRAEGPKAFVSIMEGCSKYCSFCVVPYTRGEEFSRPLDDVLTEVVQLAQQGVREINLLGQNVNAYNGLVDNGDSIDMALLLHYIAAIDGVDRLRFTTSHPAEFSDSLIDAYAEIPQLVDHLHLPVQSGSNRILSLMKRGYTREDYIQQIARLRENRPNISLSSDFIVGFPGETEADFGETLDLIDHIGFDQSFSFVYSARPGTPAAELDDPVPLETKKQWLAELQQRITHNAARISRNMVGTVQSVLIDGHARKTPQQLSGRTENNRIVNFDGPQRLIGQLIDVEITEALPNSLRGRVKLTEHASIMQAS
ncbi:MAG: tRNA (N6-isopentenyl adenosine(37)-C2)-methylthiotransferase MiaB [Gammaproteobacteria bacterium]|nr:tRNA (N6-isopentenyl adenosine(37)-C2)-methylthiotransferase MiaB [Gammaproteobacteria bacterium]